MKVEDSNKPIRIAQIIGKWNGGGVESVVMNYYRHIDRNRFQFDFIIDEDSRNVPIEKIEKLGGRIIFVPPYQKPFKYIRALKKVFKENKYRIVHSHINTLSVFPLYAAKKVGVKVRIAHSHSTTNKKEPLRNFLKNFLRLFSKKYATDYFACSELAGRYQFGNKAFDQGKVTIIHNAIDIEKFKPNKKIREEIRKEFGAKEDTLVIGHVGRFVKTKNHKFLVNIFNEVHKQNPNSILVLAGEGPLLLQTINQVKKLGLEKSVKFLGQRKDIEKVYQAMDVFCLPSLYEGFGMVALEAQVAGIKCICSENIPTIMNSKNIKLRHTHTWITEILRKDKQRFFQLHDEYNIEIEKNKLQNLYIRRSK